MCPVGYVVLTSEIIFFFINRVGTFNFLGAGYGSFSLKKKTKTKKGFLQVNENC